MTSFSEFYKLKSLVISDRVSSMLSVNFDITDMDCSEGDYTEFAKDLPEFAYIGLFQYFSRGILLLIDSKVIYKLSNKMLGGKGLVEEKENQMFTSSEDLLGNELLSWFTEYYKQHKVKLTFLRVEQKIENVHYFFPDEKILGVKMKCKIDKEEMGYVAICHPKLFLDKQKEAWAEN